MVAGDKEVDVTADQWLPHRDMRHGSGLCGAQGQAVLKTRLSVVICTNGHATPNRSAGNRSFGRTGQGGYLLGPKVMEKGNVVGVLFGGKMRFVLRPWDDGRFLLVGECCVHGFLQGEAMELLERGEIDEETFHLVDCFGRSTLSFVS